MKKFPVCFSRPYTRHVYRISYRQLRCFVSPDWESMTCIRIADNARRSKFHRNDQFTGWTNSLRYAAFLNRKYDVNGELPF